MPFDLTVRPPRTVDGHLELLAQTIMASGLGWGWLAGRWPDIRAGFERFSVRKVSLYGEKDVQRLLDSAGMVRNRAKIEAVIAAAVGLAEIREKHGSVLRWLGEMDGFGARRRALKRFPYIGDWGAYYVLSVAGYEVPSAGVHER